MRTAAIPSALALSVTCLTACAAASPVAQEVPSPAEQLGRPIATDFQLADWDETRAYYEALAAASPRVLVDAIGTTTEGRPYLRAVVSSEGNLARLAEIRQAAARLADPRGLTEPEREALLAAGRPIVMVSCQMHSTETAGTEFGMELAHTLATSDEEPWRSAREELVVVILPNTNPDGLDRVVHWWREHVGTPFEGSGTLELYQRYAGHDNNRDWFGLALEETRIVTREIYSVWHPTVYWDVHQQGSSEERFFVPPFRDPLNPNLDPAIIAGIDALGSRALLDLTRAGFTGVSTGVSYDMWWNGGNRNVPVRHNIIGLLTEAASVDIAAPIFLEHRELRGPGDLPHYAPSNRFPAPWPGGWWRLRDIVDYERAFAASLFGSLAREPRTYLANAMEAAQRAADRGVAEAPRAWVVPSDERDVGAVRRLADILLVSGVEVYVTDDALEADGRAWPAGSIVVPRAQPYGQYVKDLMEVQRYPDGEAPYDVAGWTLPLLLGVHRVEVLEELTAPLRRVHDADAAIGQFAGASGSVVLDPRDSRSWPQAFAMLAGGDPVSLGEAGLELGGITGLQASAMPRVGLYSPWSGSMSEGWARWVFDTAGLPFVRVRNEQLRAGRLGELLDVLVLPAVSGRQLDRGRGEGSVPSEYAGGLDPEGAVAVEEFVRAGGKLIAMSGSAEWAIDLLQLEVQNSVRDAEGFSCPGSVLRAVPAEHALTAGLPASLPVFFSRSAAWDVEPSDTLQVVLRYAPTRLLLSGWIQGEDAIEGDAAWVRATYGEGTVDLFGFQPQYRSWSQACFPLLFRAILF